MHLDPRQYFFARFGISLPDNLEFSFTKNKVYAFNKEVEKGETFGIVALKRTNRGFKPSSEFLQLFGNLAMRNVVFISKKEINEYLKGNDLIVDNTLSTDGYVVVCYKNYAIGCGLLIGNKLINQVPKTKQIKN